MSKCKTPGTISNGYPTSSKSTYAKDDEVGFVCHDSYKQTGTPTITCNGTHWIGAPKCSLDFIDDVWFWLLIGLGLLLTIAIITALCYYCTKRHRYRRRNRVRALNSDEDESVGCCGDVVIMVEVVMSVGALITMDVVHCMVAMVTLVCVVGFSVVVDVVVNHSKVTGEEWMLPGMFSILIIKTLLQEYQQGGKSCQNEDDYLKNGNEIKKKRQRMVESRDYVSDRVENPLNDETYGKVRRSAKDLAIWLPHSNPVRSINTSTK